MAARNRWARAARSASVTATGDGRDPEPSAGIIDSQSVKAAAVVGAATRGYDGAKKINGRKRHLAVDCRGRL